MSNLVPILGGAVIALLAMWGGIANARRRGEPIPPREFVAPVTVIALMGLGMFLVVQLFDGAAVIVAIVAVAALGVFGFAWQARHAAGDGGREV